LTRVSINQTNFAKWDGLRSNAAMTLRRFRPCEERSDEAIQSSRVIDTKDARYCEGCDLATLAHSAAFSARPALRDLQA
jgi:hypothetical protein